MTYVNVGGCEIRGTVVSVQGEVDPIIVLKNPIDASLSQLEKKGVNILDEKVLALPFIWLCGNLLPGSKYVHKAVWTNAQH